MNEGSNQNKPPLHLADPILFKTAHHPQLIQKTGPLSTKQKAPGTAGALLSRLYPQDLENIQNGTYTYVG